MSAGVLEGFGHGALGDLVEDDALHLLAGLGRKFLGDVPADGLAFAVGVGGEVDGRRVGGRRLDLLENLFPGREDLVLGGEPPGDVDTGDLEPGSGFPFLGLFRPCGRAFLGAGNADGDPLLGKVPDMAHGGLDLVVLPQVLVDGLGFSRRFDDDEILGQLLFLTVPSTYRAPGRRLMTPCNSSSLKRLKSPVP